MDKFGREEVNQSDQELKENIEFSIREQFNKSVKDNYIKDFLDPEAETDGPWDKELEGLPL